MLTWFTLNDHLSTKTYVLRLQRPTRVGWEGTATHVVRWYNRQERSWVVSYGNVVGNAHDQIGSSEYCGTLADALAWSEYLIGFADR